MARIELENLRHAYGSAPASDADYALKRVHHAFDDGGAYALLGPSGCGKTTLLNIISGLVHPSEGKLLFDGEDVTAKPTAARNIAQVFQFPVIYDTMTVRENLMFPLRNRGMKRAEARKRVDEILSGIGLAGIADKRARGLSADQKQKVSLGRGLVRSDVAAILFDEPLTVIDPQMKWELRTQLRALHDRFRRTMIYVTHDQTEALTFADKVAVMYEGEIVQIGTPEELFARPGHTFVGYFIGSPGMNVLPATLDSVVHQLGPQAIALAAAAKVSPEKKMELGVRPEHVRVGSEGIPVRVERVEDAGRLKIVRAKVEGHDIAAIVSEDANIPAEAHLSFAPAGVHLYADGWRIGAGGAQ